MQTIDVNPQETGLSHLSFSAVRDFLKNPRMFRKRWIDLDFDRTPQLALIEGSAFHAGLEAYWGYIYAGVHLNKKRGIQVDFEEMKAFALRKAEMECGAGTELKKKLTKAEVPIYEGLGCVIETIEGTTKTGRATKTHYAVLTPEAICRPVFDNFANYMNERDEQTYTPLAIELAAVAKTIDPETNQEHPFPLKARIDLIARMGEEIVIVDHKYNGDDPEEDEDGNLIPTPAMKLQAGCYESIAPEFLKTLGVEGKVETVIFDVMNKKSGKISQVKVKVGNKERVMWARVFRGVQHAILLAYAVGDYNSAFLPNPDDWSPDGWVEFEKDVEFSLDTGEKVRKVEKQTVEYEPVDL